MGKELGTTFFALSQELTWLNVKWSEYVVLFGTKPERLDLLNEAASFFFGVVQRTLWDETLLHIARITDPPESFGKQKLTILRLESLLGDHPALRRRVSVLAQEALSAATFCRDWRNRRLAHLDFALATDQQATPLPAVSRQTVKACLDSLADVLNAISEHCEASTTPFDLVPRSEGAESLLYVLDAGLGANRERLERILSRQASDDDFPIKVL